MSNVLFLTANPYESKLYIWKLVHIVFNIQHALIIYGCILMHIYLEIKNNK